MKFENLKIRQESITLYNEISQTIEWNDNIRYFFKDQIMRATLSISNNIAEWFERETNKELQRFLYISRWSCWEVRSMLYIALKQNYINKEQFDYYQDKTKHISIMIYKYIKTLNIN